VKGEFEIGKQWKEIRSTSHRGLEQIKQLIGSFTNNVDIILFNFEVCLKTLNECNVDVSKLQLQLQLQLQKFDEKLKNIKIDLE
jgi:hypothetical protein